MKKSIAIVTVAMLFGIVQPGNAEPRHGSDVSGPVQSVSLDWTIEGVGDFNGDHEADILWRHTSGLVYIWLMKGTSTIGEGSPGSVPLDWSIQSVGDFNSDRKSDILWRHSSGLVYMWMMNGVEVIIGKEK